MVTIPNNILQGDFALAGINTGRFLINSTVGVLGLIDVAQHIGMPEYEKEDYGQSLQNMESVQVAILFCPFLVQAQQETQ